MFIRNHIFSSSRVFYIHTAANVKNIDYSEACLLLTLFIQVGMIRSSNVAFWLTFHLRLTLRYIMSQSWTSVNYHIYSTTYKVDKEPLPSRRTRISDQYWISIIARRSEETSIDIGVLRLSKPFFKLKKRLVVQPENV